MVNIQSQENKWIGGHINTEIMITTFLLYLIVKELSFNYRKKKTFDQGFRQGIEAATPIFEK